MDQSRRRFLGVSGSVVSTALLGGCSALPGGGGTASADPSGAAPAFRQWVPSPGETNGGKGYATNDVVFWDVERIRDFEADLHPSFYDRLSSVAETFVPAVSPSSVSSVVSVADESATVYRGSFDTNAVGSALEDDGFSVGQELGAFDVYLPSDAQSPFVVGVGESAVVVGEGADIQTTSGQTSNIDERTAVVETVTARRDADARYGESNGTFRTLADESAGFDGGELYTHERVSDPAPENLQFEGAVGAATGMQFDRPKSTFALVFAFSDASEAVVDPVASAFEELPGTRQFENPSSETDGRVVTVTAEMENSRFDGYLPGDPGDRN